MKKKTTTDQLVSVSDYATAHNKSLAWAYKQVKQKKVSTTRIGKTIFIVSEK